ncbi:MAG: hypothetical protein H7Y88_08635 [Phycisphaerales bacterium]|nr:hypothetical protein [Phycisphaerales bacterium]
MTHPASDRKAFRIAFLMAAAAASFLIGGCDDDNQAAEAIQTASMRLDSISGGGASTAPWTSDRLKVYSQIVTGLEPALASDLPGEVSAARLLKSRALAGQAQVEADIAAQQQRGFSHKGASSWSALDRYLSSQALASALEEYDPEPAFEDIQGTTREREEDIATAWAAKKKVDDAIADLEKRAEGSLAQARTRREQETQFRARAADVSATQAATIIEDAAKERRAADLHDVDAARLQAEATNLSPQSLSAQAQIDMLTAQKQLLAEARQEIEAIATVNRDKAKDAREAAATAAADVGRLLDELIADRQSIDPAIDKAAATLKAAATEARQAASGDGLSADKKSGAKLAEASRLHALADVISLRTSGLRSHAALLSALASAAPTLPDGGKLSAAADQATKELEAALAAAKEAYEAAKNAYESASGRSVSKEQIERIAADLDKLANPDQIEASRRDFPSGDEDLNVEESAPVEGDAPPADEATTASVRATFRDLADAAEKMDIEAIFSKLQGASEKESSLLRDAKSFAGSALAFESACKEKFDKGFIELFKESPMGAGLGDQFGFSQFTGNLAEARAEIDTVEVFSTGPQSARITQDGEPLNFIRSGGQWKVLVEIPAEMEAGIQGFASVLPDLKVLADEMTADVKADKFQTPDVMLMALFQKVGPIMQKTGLGGMGGPGGG